MEMDFGICDIVAILVFLKSVKAQLLMNIQHNNNHDDLLLCLKPNPMQLSVSDACEVALLSSLLSWEKMEGWQKTVGTFALKNYFQCL